MTEYRSLIAGVGGHLPDRVLTNAELAKMVDTSDEWIRERTGISERHIAAEGEKTSDLALVAARKALEHGGLDAKDLDLIVLATATPDLTFPSTASRVQAELSFNNEEYGKLEQYFAVAFGVGALIFGAIASPNTADARSATVSARASS